MTRSPNDRTLVVAIVAITLAAGLAGCASGTGGIADYGSYEDAKNAPGQTYEPENHTGVTDLHLKLLHPADPDNAEQGQQPIVILLFDSLTDEPATNAQVSLTSDMPAMGHGTSEEEDPVHQEHGVYLGQTNHMMPGGWDTEIDVFLPDTGEEFTFTIEFTVNQ